MAQVILTPGVGTDSLHDQTTEDLLGPPQALCRGDAEQLPAQLSPEDGDDVGLRETSAEALDVARDAQLHGGCTGLLARMHREPRSAVLLLPRDQSVAQREDWAKKK